MTNMSINYTFWLFVSVLACSCIGSKEEKWEWAFTVDYDFFGSFSEGLAPVYKEVKYNNYANKVYMGFVDKTGKTVIPVKFTYPTYLHGFTYLTNYCFNEGLSVVGENTRYGNVYGYADKMGNVVIPCKFNVAFHFSEGLAAVQVNTGIDTKGYTIEKKGYIDKTGKMIIPATFSSAENFSEGLAKVTLSGERKGELWDVYYIDKTGRVIISTPFKNTENFSDGLAKVTEFYEGDNNPYYGYIDKTGKVVIPPKYYWAGNFSEGLAWVRDEKNGQMGYINKSGQMVIPANFYSAQDFHEGLAYATTKGKCGFIDKTGAMVITIPCPTISPPRFSEGFSVVEGENGKYGYIDRTGNFIVPPIFNKASNFSEGLASVSIDKEHKKGFIRIKN